MKQVAVLLADGFEEVEAVTAIDLLRRADIAVSCVGVTGRDVVGGHEIRISTDITVDELDIDLDGVVIPGGLAGARSIASNGDAMRLIKRLMESGKLVAAICAAPAVVLAPAGLIGGRSFTCYPGLEKDVTDGRFSDARVVVDGNLITSRGPGTAAEFSEAVITHLIGPDAAETVHSGTLQP
jgi:4-methyl-5(b-hydroxyethyl)-thiazole monophosphate biosynthesis